MSKNSDKIGIIGLCFLLVFILMCIQLNYLNYSKDSMKEQKMDIPNNLKPKNINSNVNGVFSLGFPYKI